MAKKRKKSSGCNVKKEYGKFLRVMIRDAREITGEKRVPKHLRAAVKSHAERLARVRCANKKGR